MSPPNFRYPASTSIWVCGHQVFTKRSLRRVPGGRLGQKIIRIIKGGITSSYHAARGRLVLLDRVAYDARLPGAVDHSVGGRITSALAHRFSPTPDALFVLDAPGEVMFARKGEHSVGSTGEVAKGVSAAGGPAARDLFAGRHHASRGVARTRGGRRLASARGGARGLSPLLVANGLMTPAEIQPDRNAGRDGLTAMPSCPFGFGNAWTGASFCPYLSRVTWATAVRSTMSCSPQSAS